MNLTATQTLTLLPASTSTSANVILLEDIPIHWKSQRQRSTATSTVEAEYVSLSTAAKSASFLNALHYFCHGSNVSIRFKCDNNSAISFASAASIPSKLRHINVANHYVREFIASSGASVEYVSTDCNFGFKYGNQARGVFKYTTLGRCVCL